MGYSFLNSVDGYSRDMHFHGGGDFGLGVISTSHIKSIWSQLKAILKPTYYNIPHQNFIPYLREWECRVKNKEKNLNQKINEFFENWNLIYDMPSENLYRIITLMKLKINKQFIFIFNK